METWGAIPLHEFDVALNSSFSILANFVIDNLPKDPALLICMCNLILDGLARGEREIQELQELHEQEETENENSTKPNLSEPTQHIQIVDM